MPKDHDGDYDDAAADDDDVHDDDVPDDGVHDDHGYEAHRNKQKHATVHARELARCPNLATRHASPVSPSHCIAISSLYPLYHVPYSIPI